MTTEPNTATVEQAGEMLCPFRDQVCAGDRCMAWRWTPMIDQASKAPVGQCGLSAATA